MNDDDDDDPKMFSDFAETLHVDSTPQVNIFIFGVKRENFLMGLKIDFKFEIFGKIYLGFPYKNFIKGFIL